MRASEATVPSEVASAGVLSPFTGAAGASALPFVSADAATGGEVDLVDILSGGTDASGADASREVKRERLHESRDALRSAVRSRSAMSK